MQNILTVEEVVERIKKADSAPRQPQMLYDQPRRPEFYVSMLTRRLLMSYVQHVSWFIQHVS
jgi:hypothetical protein